MIPDIITPVGYEIDIQEDPQTGQFTATIPALDLSKQGTFDEVSEWSMEELAEALWHCR